MLIDRCKAGPARDRVYVLYPPASSLHFLSGLKHYFLRSLGIGWQGKLVSNKFGPGLLFFLDSGMLDVHLVGEKWVWSLGEGTRWKEAVTRKCLICVVSDW